MTSDELRSLVISCLEKTIPEVDPASIDPKRDLRDQLDIDSMDFLRFLRALHEATTVDIPEIDAPRLATLEGAVRYLGSKGLVPSAS